jgi:outer membrane protein
MIAASLAGIAVAQTPAQPKAVQPKTAQPKATQPKTAPTSAPLKIGVVRTRGLLLASLDGKKAVATMNASLDARKKDLERRKIAITDLQLRLDLGKDTMSPEVKADLTRTIDQQTRDQNRLVDDMQAEMTQEQQRIFTLLGEKLAQVIRKYALANGYTAVVDGSSAGVVYASNTFDITAEIASLFDKSPSALPGAAPAKPASAAKK